MSHHHLTVRVAFSAAHRLFNPDWDEARNREVYAECAHPGGHGHNYVLEVTVAGTVDPATGMVINLKGLKRRVQDHVVAVVDHRDLNHDVPELEGAIPTSENLVALAWRLLAGRIPGATLHRLRLHETDRSFVTYYGPESGETPPGRKESP